MNLEFYLLETLGETDEELCVLGSLYKGIKMSAWRFQLGEPMTGNVPENPQIEMDPDWPGIRLSDLLGNTMGVLMVSTKLKEAIEKHARGARIEFFNFALLDHRKRVHSKDYWLVNPVGTHDVLDVKKSKINWKRGKVGVEARSVDELVLDRAKCKDAPQLFRPKHDPTRYVVGVELAREIYDRDFTNVLWSELSFGDAA